MPDAAPWFQTSGPPEAPVAVLVHGSMDRSAGLLRLARRLHDEFHVVRFDRRGYGRSADLGGPFTVDQHIIDCETVLAAAVPDRSVAVAFGHSFGGNVVLGLAARRPELIARAVVYESPLSWRVARRTPAEPLSPPDAAERFMRTLLGDTGWELLPSAARRARRAEGVAMVAELDDLAAAAPWEPHQIAAPVLAMAGEHGSERHRAAMRTVVDDLHHCGGAAELFDVAGAGHLGPNTHAAEVAAAVRRFASAAH